MKEDRVLERLRAICLALPETDEVRTWGHSTFRARKKAFAVLEVAQPFVELLPGPPALGPG